MSPTTNLPPAQWRLLCSPPAPGDWNMAVDIAILESAAKGDVLPTLRLYAWDAPCLSLGYAQPLGDVDLARLDSLGWKVVRRPTGGRAILHADELTYAVIAPRWEARLAGGVIPSYRRISRALLAALRGLGLPVQATRKAKDSPNNKEAVCFEHPSDYEITVGGKKLIGSAQSRKKEGVLQHGTLPLHGDLTRITQVLHFPSEEKRAQAAGRLLEKATTVEMVLGGHRLSWDTAAQAFATAFENTLNLTLVEGELTSKEEQRAQELVKEKYAQSEWTERR